MKRISLLIFLALLLGCSNDGAPTAESESQAGHAELADADGWNKGGMATAANSHAVAAAIEMLKMGGHAVDAAIAAHTVLGLVEPQSSGLGGGGFMLVYEREEGELTFHEGREVAPSGATVDMFMPVNEDGKIRRRVFAQKFLFQVLSLEHIDLLKV